MNLIEVLTKQSKLRGDAPALIARRNGRDVVLTFLELAVAVEIAAGRLQESGLRRGDRVLVFQAMSIELYVALLALFRLGMVAMFLDPSAGKEHIERCCALGKPRGLIASRKAHLLRFTSLPVRRIPLKFAIGGWVLGAQSLEGIMVKTEIALVPDDAEALLTFTSGSTGIPKAAVRSHGFLLAQHRVLEGSIHLRAGEVDLATLPVFVLANLASGLTSLLPDADLRRPGFIEAGPVVRQIAIYQPTRAAGSPAFFERLLEYYEKHPGEACSLRDVYTGGAAVFPSLLQRMKRVWPNCAPVAVYGSTEAEPIAHLTLEEIREEDLRAMESGAGILAGKPVPEIAVRLAEDGEIQVAGRHVLPGYLDGAGDAETKIREGETIWHRTGDAGRFDAAGRLWLLGRSSARLSGGLYPFTVECAAMAVPWVKRCGCVEVGAKRVLAAEVLGGEPRRHDDTKILMEKLAWAKLDRVEILGALPVDKRHNAKVDYNELRQMLGEAIP